MSVNYIPINQQVNEMNQKEVEDQGFLPLSASELELNLCEKCFLGNYLHGFKFITSINTDGTLEGKNNVGTHVLGRWAIDSSEHTFSVKWNGGWDNTTTRGFKVDGEIKFFDVDTGVWRNTLIKEIDTQTVIKSYSFG